jgi:hypothetical protein
MTTDKTLDLALEALEYIHEGANNQGPHTGISWRCVAVKAEPAIKAIKQARALDKKAENARELGLDYEPAPVHKPMHPEIKKMYEDYFDKCFRESSAAVPENFMDALRFDVAMRDAAPVQEPVALVIDGILVKSSLPKKYTGHLYTTPPAAQRQWVGLKVEEIEAIGKPYEEKDRSMQAWGLFACAIENKLKEKNT